MKISYKNLSRILFFLVLFVTIYKGCIMFSNRINANTRTDTNFRYPLLSSEMILNDKVVDSVSTHRGFTRILFRDFEKYSIRHSRNYKYPEVYLGNFLMKGDRLSKMKYSDTLRIVRDDNEFIFVIGESLNKND